jgi:hypothetical protein
VPAKEVVKATILPFAFLSNERESASYPDVELWR